MTKRPLLLALPLLLCAGSAWGQSQGGGYSMPSIYGPTGLLRVFSADGGKAGSFRLQFLGEYFRASEFLAANPSDTNSRLGGRFHLSVAPVDWLEVFASLQASSNDNNRSTPTLIQTQGDLAIGVKGCYRIYKFFCIGAEGSAHFLTGAGDVSFTIKSTSFFLRLLATTDLRELSAKIPLRIHFNFGATIDNSDALLDPRFDQVQRFALRINESHRLFLGLGLEAPVSRYVTPFVEWSFEIPVGLADDPTAAGGSSYPNIVSIGARVFPWKQLALLAAFDIGLTSAGRRGVPAVPPWQFLFGLGWSFDTTSRPPKVVERVKIKEVVKEKVVTKQVPVPTPAPPTTGILTGAVVDSRTAQPVTNAALRFLGTTYTAFLSGRDKGDFRVPGLKPGKLRVRVEREGYKPAVFEVVLEAGKETANSFPIDRVEKPKTGVLVGKLTDRDGKPLVGIIEVQRLGGGATKKLTTDPSSGAFVGQFPAGKYLLLARATGYLSRERQVTLAANERLVVDFSLRKAPTKRTAKLVGSKIVITKQVRFSTGSARIVGRRSFAILDEVSDILTRNRNIQKIRIEGHTDNVGGRKYNRRLSDRRARAVMEYLVQQGISPNRLESVGYGQSRPLRPNTSRRNKALNRRVEFLILEQ